MKTTLAIVTSLLSLPFSASTALAATAEPTSSAMQWVMMIDHGRYAQSYADGSAVFQAGVTEAAFEGTTKLYRETVGNELHRDVEGVSMSGDLSNLPKGQYAVVHFRTEFAKKKDAQEIVYLAYQNGLWRVAAYDIK